MMIDESGAANAKGHDASSRPARASTSLVAPDLHTTKTTITCPPPSHSFSSCSPACKLLFNSAGEHDHEDTTKNAKPKPKPNSNETTIATAAASQASRGPPRSQEANWNGSARIKLSRELMLRLSSAIHLTSTTPTSDKFIGSNLGTATTKTTTTATNVTKPETSRPPPTTPKTEKPTSSRTPDNKTTTNAKATTTRLTNDNFLHATAQTNVAEQDGDDDKDDDDELLLCNETSELPRGARREEEDDDDNSAAVRLKSIRVPQSNERAIAAAAAAARPTPGGEESRKSTTNARQRRVVVAAAAAGLLFNQSMNCSRDETESEQRDPRPRRDHGGGPERPSCNYCATTATTTTADTSSSIGLYASGATCGCEHRRNHRHETTAAAAAERQPPLDGDDDENPIKRRRKTSGGKSWSKQTVISQTINLYTNNRNTNNHNDHANTDSRKPETNQRNEANAGTERAKLEKNSVLFINHNYSNVKQQQLEEATTSSSSSAKRVCNQEVVDCAARRRKKRRRRSRSSGISTRAASAWPVSMRWLAAFLLIFLVPPSDFSLLSANQQVISARPGAVRAQLVNPGGRLAAATSTTSSLSDLDALADDDSSNELNRAILATMSTQSTLMATEQFGPNSNGSGAGRDELAPTATATTTTATSLIGAADQFGLDGNFTSSSLAPSGAAAAAEQQQTFASKAWDKFLDFGRIFLIFSIIVGDICGNSLVILSVCRHSKLRVTTNWFVVSLACADILVALFAMTFNASVIISGRWLFNRWVCDFWNSCDVLASTASILHLCCISIDRYIAIMRPLEYPTKITTRRVMYALCAVWISSALLSYIPIFTGIYTTSEQIELLQQNPDQCEFVVNRVYAIVSSSISFWIPCCIMVFTYYRIYREATRQEKFIYKAQSLAPAPMVNHHVNSRSKQRRSKSVAVASLSHQSGQHGAAFKPTPLHNRNQLAPVSELNSSGTGVATTNLSGIAESEPLTGSAVDLNNNNNNNSDQCNANANQFQLKSAGQLKQQQQQQHQAGRLSSAAAMTTKKQGLNSSSSSNNNNNNNDNDDDDDDRDSNSGQSTPTKRSISKMKREHKAAKTLGIIMGVFILCWLPFFSWYTPQHICGSACNGIIPHQVVTLLFWIGYFNSTLNPIIYAYFNHEFRDAFKKTLQWIFCCCQDLKCLRVNRPNDNQHYNCTYRSTQEIGLVSNG